MSLSHFWAQEVTVSVCPQLVKVKQQQPMTCAGWREQQDRMIPMCMRFVALLSDDWLQFHPCDVMNVSLHWHI